MRGLLIAVIAVLIAGFLTRRLMMPSAVRFWNDRFASHPQSPGAASTEAASNEAKSSAPANSANGSGEHINDNDRRALDEVIKRKTGQ